MDPTEKTTFLLIVCFLTCFYCNNNNNNKKNNIDKFGNDAYIKADVSHQYLHDEHQGGGLLIHTASGKYEHLTRYLSGMFLKSDTRFLPEYNCTMKT